MLVLNKQNKQKLLDLIRYEKKRILNEAKTIKKIKKKKTNKIRI